MNTESPAKIKVFCITEYFLPGYVGGGPITTLANLRSQLSNHVYFLIFTKDRDLGSFKKYPNVMVDNWTKTTDSEIFYASPSIFSPIGLKKVLNEKDFSIFYLNSFFSPYASIFPFLILRRLGKNNTPILIAPRGEFSSGALSIKRYKKILFLFVARLTGIYKNVLWHASTDREAVDILRLFPDAIHRVFVAADPVLIRPNDVTLSRPNKIPNKLNICFISRISPMKNLDGLIRILQCISLPIQLDVYGPIEDEAYWGQCVGLIKNLPNNIQVKHYGAIPPQSVTNTFSKYDLFAFPTHGENFGHVIFEALSAGTPVLVSDQTPWQQDEKGALTVIPLNEVAAWRLAIQKAANRSDEQQKQVSQAARNYAIQYAEAVDTKKQNLELFSKVLNYPMK